MRFIDKSNRDLTLYELELTAKIHDIEMYATEDNTENGVKVDYLDINRYILSNDDKPTYSLLLNNVPVLDFCEFDKIITYIFNRFDYQTNFYLFNYDGSTNLKEL